MFEGRTGGTLLPQLQESYIQGFYSRMLVDAYILVLSDFYGLRKKGVDLELNN